jgi:hypothetical protein
LSFFLVGSWGHYALGNKFSKRNSVHFTGCRLMTAVKRLYVLLCGFEVLPKTISTRDRGARFILSEPVCAYLLDTHSGWILLDAGLNPDNGARPAS